MAKQMIEAGACAIQIENQVSDEKQCGHQDGKVTVTHADFLAKINAVLENESKFSYSLRTTMNNEKITNKSIYYGTSKFGYKSSRIEENINYQKDYLKKYIIHYYIKYLLFK